MYNLLMNGGGMKNGMLPTLMKSKGSIGLLYLFIGILSLVLLKSYIVKITYNTIWPIIVKNNGQQTNHFKPLSLYEAMVFVILILFLF